MIKHSNIEKSFYKYISENLEVPYSYAISYGEVSFETNPHDLWLVVAFENSGAGAKKHSDVRIDIMSRTIGSAFNNEETTAIDLIREVLTNVDIFLYDFVPATPVLIPDEKLIIKNNDGRFTVDRVILNNLREEDLRHNLRRSSVLFRLKLLTDTVRGRFV